MLEHYYYEKEFKVLNKHKIKYLVIGGIAVNLYGLHRFTRDLDLMISLSSENFDKFLEVMKELGYESRVPRSEWKKHAGIAFRNKTDQDKRIDIFLKNPIDFDSSYKSRKIINVDDKFSVSCVSLENLIELKEKADRVRDWIDLGSLKRMIKLKDNEK
ncbi:MAG: nucleotidyltransferase [Candidatus Margulisbacteria bacterium]|nr:nucleotidyltransferase [Candidatus Margulisiibacteriota bacterium]